MDGAANLQVKIVLFGEEGKVYFSSLKRQVPFSRFALATVKHVQKQMWHIDMLEKEVKLHFLNHIATMVLCYLNREVKTC